MNYSFSYIGGVAKPKTHVSEKFLLFFIINGKEVPFYSLKQDGLITQYQKFDEASRVLPKFSHYVIGVSNVAKLFIGQQGFGIPRMYYSLYFRLTNSGGPKLKIFPFSGKSSEFFFSAQAQFLKKAEALTLLEEASVSRRFLRNQEMLPTALLKRMIFIDKTEMRKGIRHVQLSGGKNG